MTTITAEGPMLAVLRQANGPAEIRDPEGQVIGFFVPTSAERIGAIYDPAAIARAQEARM